jgi:hypothetical protein
MRSNGTCRPIESHRGLQACYQTTGVLERMVGMPGMHLPEEAMLSGEPTDPAEPIEPDRADRCH